MAAPTITSLSPSYGTAAGGTSVTITGTGFTGATAVKFGTTNATAYTVVGATSITATAPAGTPGLTHVYVTNADGTNTAATTDYFENVGLFSLAEARAFDKGQLRDVATYTDAAITSAEARIRDDLQQICRVYFYPTSVSEYLDGDGSDKLIVSWPEVTSVTACVIYDSDGAVDETFDSTDLADLAVYPWSVIVRRTEGLWNSGNRNVYITYTCGYTTVPEPIKYAALRLCLWQMVPNNIDQRMTALTSDGRTWTLATAGRYGSWYGLPEVDSILQRYNRTLPGIA